MAVVVEVGSRACACVGPPRQFFHRAEPPRLLMSSHPRPRSPASPLPIFSHPGFGCWMSGVDINTQQSFEALNQRAVAVVVDPIQSVKGKVVIDCFRLINPQSMMMGQEPRQTTSNVGHLKKPSIQALIHGLNRWALCQGALLAAEPRPAAIADSRQATPRHTSPPTPHHVTPRRFLRHYYSMVLDYRKNELEMQMLTNLHKKVRRQRAPLSSQTRLLATSSPPHCHLHPTTISLHPCLDADHPPALLGVDGGTQDAEVRGAEQRQRDDAQGTPLL